MPDMTLDEIRDAIARHKGYKLTANGWELDAGMGVTLDLFDHPVPASIDWVAQQWPKERDYDTKYRPGNGWTAWAWNRITDKTIERGPLPTELHARFALLLAVLDAEGTR